MQFIEFPNSEEEIENNYIPIQRVGYPSTKDVLTSEKQTVVEYDLSTKKETIKNLSTIFANNTQVEPYEGLGVYLSKTNPDSILPDTFPHASYVFPPDDRILVPDTTEFPWRTVCKIKVTAPNGSQYVGSGAIIDRFHVLTCGHVVHIKDAGGWVTECTIIPGMDGYYEPYLSAQATLMRSYTGWTNDELPEHDWALLTLDRAIGDITGWMGRKTEASPNSIYSDGVNTAGYPGDLNFGWNMYHTYDNGDGASEYLHYFWLDIAGGQSGSPVWEYDGSNRYIISIVTYSRLGYDSNFGTRLNSDKFNQINTWIAQDAGEPPSELPDLIADSLDLVMISPKIFKGRTTVDMSVLVTNYGTTSTTSTIGVNFYFSTDSTINSADFLIGTDSIPSLSALSSSYGFWTGQISQDVPDGLYYLGAKVDPSNTITEPDETNNVALYDFLVDIKSTLISKILGNPVWLALSISGLVVVVGGTTAGIVVGVKRKQKRITEQTLKPLPAIEPISTDANIIGLCAYCGKPLQSEMKFCQKCGTPTPQERIEKKYSFCYYCGKRLTLEMDFCTYCGKKRLG